MTHNTPLSVEKLRAIRAQDRRMNWGQDFTNSGEHADDALIENLIEASRQRVYDEPSYGL